MTKKNVEVIKLLDETSAIRSEIGHLLTVMKQNLL